MNNSNLLAPVLKSLTVNASPQVAFEVFTGGIDRWWPKSHGLGSTPVRNSFIEPFVGGRWYTIFEDGSEAVVGHVRVWEPAVRFVVSWEISAAWKPDTRAHLASEVVVTFRATAEGGTLVELLHHNFERMGEEEGKAMRKAVEGGWSAILEFFRGAVLSSAGEP